MARVLHAASVLAMIMSGVVIVLVAQSGFLLRSGALGQGRIGDFLNGPGAVDRFKRQYRGDSQDQNDSAPSIIRQAELFASVIDPPLRVSTGGGPIPHEQTDRRDPPPPPPLVDFSLMGTSHSPESGESFAYVCLVDRTFRWVHQGEEIGHTAMEDVRHGSIAYSKATRRGVMAVEPVPGAAAVRP